MGNHAVPSAGSPKSPTDWFVKSRLGLFLHWGLYSLAARHEWLKHFERLDDAHYQRYFDHFYPDLYNPREWARQARAAGMEYMVITTKHHEGFCLWDSKHTDYKATKTPWAKDVLRPMVEAFREEGIRVGFYYSLIDWHHPEFPVDRIHPQRDDKAYREAAQGRDMRKYARYMRDQVTELLTGFGPIDLLWFDFSYPGEDGKGRDDWESEALLELVRKLQPQALVNNRLDLPHQPDFVTPEQYQPDAMLRDAEGNPVVWEGCQTLSGSWGYHRDEMTWKSVRQLLGMLIDGVSKNGNLLLNVGPTARGEFDWRARERLAGIGEWMHYNARSIKDCGPAPEGWVAPPDTRYTWNAETGRLYLHFFHWPYKHVHLSGLAGKVRYAQFLHDASEVVMRTAQTEIHAALNASTPEGALTLELPTLKPPVEFPVIELFLKETD